MVKCNYSPEIQIGKDYLLCLYKPSWGGGSNTKGDYYYVTGFTLGAFEVKDTPSGTQMVSVEGSREGDQLLRQIQEFSAAKPVNEKIQLEKLMQALQINLDTGFISQEEYDFAIAKGEEYAKIVAIQISE